MKFITRSVFAKHGLSSALLSKSNNKALYRRSKFNSFSCSRIGSNSFIWSRGWGMGRICS